MADWSAAKANSLATRKLRLARRVFPDLFPKKGPDAADKIPTRIEVDFYEVPMIDGGIYSSAPEIIILNKPLLDWHGDEAWEDTVAHEVGHCVIFRTFGHRANDHGWEWRRMVRALGGEGTAMHDYSAHHIAVRHPERFFLYQQDGNALHWFTARAHKVRQGLKRAGRKCKDGCVHVPHLVDSVRRRVRKEERKRGILE